MWKKWKIWDNVYKKSMLRAFARSRAKKWKYGMNETLASNFTSVQTFHSQAMNYEKYWKEAAQNAI